MDPNSFYTPPNMRYPLPDGKQLQYSHATREFHPADSWKVFSRLPLHQHLDLHLVIVLSGKNSYRHLEQERSWSAHEGVLINSAEPHEVRPLYAGSLEYTQITFQVLDTTGTALPYSWEQLAQSLGGYRIDRAQITSSTWQALTPELLAAVEALRNGDALSVTGRLFSIVARLARAEQDVRPPEFMHLEERVLQELQRCWNTDMLASCCGWSTGYLHRRCRSVYNCTPMEWVYRIRLEQASSLLLEGQLPLESIAGLCGFTDAYHFSRRFKQRYGIAPGRWRKQYMSNSPLS